ncbi:hypothetical protein CJ179_38920 [Rhodococcus sp. ACS1]|uniref:hypothetical protein n=1 Tax=Rhodococcus sp. ACS1 TaxID=2028570 RepID=UPI000BB0FA7B|nr:hypothetical protein [Rhodococcus sp. ACS1]PBC38570.1 hypothetical protein CJ179_38920 [Rhodococcus sp. ACS1]
MPELIIYGASDDLVELEGYIEDEFYVDEANEFHGSLVGPGGSLGIFAKFGWRGWELSVTALENDGHAPWPFHFGDRPDRPEDPAIFIDVPEGTKLRRQGCMG